MIRSERLFADLDSLRLIGALPGGGLRRVAMSPEEMEARRFLLERMELAGLTTRTDAAGNIFGRLPGRNPKLPLLMVGSHIDTIERGGSYDGVLGVLGALECIRTLRDGKITPERTIEIVAFNDEEERFIGFLGSYALTGAIDAGDLDGVKDHHGADLTGTMRSIGLDPSRIEEARRDAGEISAFVELHIEQGPVLERAGVPVGVVKQVKGDYRWGVTVTGRTDHAGSPLEGRNDAFMAMHAIVGRMIEFRNRHGDGDTTLTVGRFVVDPNIETAQPGHVHASIDLRSPDLTFLRGAGEELARVAAEICATDGFRVAVEPILLEDPVDFDSRILQAIRDSAGELGYARMDMYSGAGHDAQVMGRHVPAAMIFVPSRDGRSHCPEEYTAPEDMEKGVNVLYGAILRLSGGQGDE